MSASSRLVVALSGSPRAGSNVDLLAEAALAGAAAAGATTLHLKARDLKVLACQACGPDPTGGHGYCIYHDDMDKVYAALERATGVLVATPVYFSGVSAQLKAVIDRCNCVTPAIVAPGGGTAFRRTWARTRRGALIAVLGPKDAVAPTQQTVRGFLSWVGARLVDTLEYRHPDLELGGVAQDAAMLERARALGRDLAGEPLAAPLPRSAAPPSGGNA